VRTLRAGDDLAPLAVALLAGGLAAIPTDTVYGLACAAHDERACARLLRAKGRDPAKPSALLAGTVASLLADVLPELAGAGAERVRRLLPGPLTLVVPNPGQRYPWLCGDDPDRIGVRVPALAPDLAAAIAQVPAVLATSLNEAGEPPATSLHVPPALAAHVAVALDAGPAPGGMPSTVVDLTGAEPVVLRAGPASLDEIRALLDLRI
jgi:L-threonylcarbamoyladenylate synthase